MFGGKLMGKEQIYLSACQLLILYKWLTGQKIDEKTYQKKCRNREKIMADVNARKICPF
jgi:hypothetical protein